MKKILFLIFLFQLITQCLIAKDKKTCNFFLVKEVNSEIIIEKVQLVENDVKVFKDESLITYLGVFNPGSKSGDLLKTNQRVEGIIAQYINGEIHISVLRKDGSQKKNPPINLEQACKVDIRLSVTGANNYKKVYLIEKYNTIKEVGGPVLDMFSDMITLEQGDYSFCTEFTEAKEDIALEGDVPYEIYKGWITIKCKLFNGVEGRFVVDFGAMRTTISKKYLPENYEIVKLQMVEHSNKDTKISSAVSAGATGNVENIAGVAQLTEFTFGNISLKEFRVMVLNKFPEIFNEYKIMGILGQDVLSKTNIIKINNFNNQDEKQQLIFLKENKANIKEGTSIPFRIAGNYLFIDGKVNNMPVSYFFDSGAATSSISNQLLKKTGTQYKIVSKGENKLMGIDGNYVDYKIAEVKNIQIGDIKINEMKLSLNDVFMLKNVGLQENTVLLGLDFFKNYNTVVFDFKASKILLNK